jgi:glucose-1-phosphate thymidylyltransferase
MKGIILAGGSATRLFPSSKSISKQIMPVYDKPMIYYSLSTLMLAKIREVLIISTPRDLTTFKQLLGRGDDFGMRFEYVVQNVPNGLAQAFILGEKFIGDDHVCLVLGDNIFYGHGFSRILHKVQLQIEGAYIFGYYTKMNKAYGVVSFDSIGNVLSIEEKPTYPQSYYVIPGLYFYDNSVIEKSKRLKLSIRGEYEITDLNNIYLNEKKLKVFLFGRGFVWLDAGNSDSLLDAACFVETIQKKQGFYIACIEEIAWRNGWIDNEKLKQLGKSMCKTEYGRYILSLFN